MARFRRRPEWVEAVQIPPDRMPFKEEPDWLRSAIALRDIVPAEKGCWKMRAVGGTVVALPADWIVQDVRGKIEFIGPATFEAHYEPDDAAQPDLMPVYGTREG